MEDLFKVIGVIVGSVIFVFVIVFLITLPLIPLMIGTCDRQFSDFEHRWGYMEGCMIKMSGKWIPSDNFREIK